MKTKYYTDDGRVFDNKDEAQAYEAELIKEKAKREKLEQEKQARKDEIKADYDALLRKIEQYNADYKEPVTFSERLSAPSRSVRTLFDLFDIFDN